VGKGRTWESRVAKEYTSRPHAIQAIQGYATLCRPSTIENAVNRAIAATEYEPVRWENPTARADWGKDRGSAGKPVPDEKTDEGTPPPDNLPKVEQRDDQFRLAVPAARFRPAGRFVIRWTMPPGRCLRARTRSDPRGRED
jgi:hypothetical protein